MDMGDKNEIKLSLMNLIGIVVFMAAVLGVGFLIGSVGNLSNGPKDNLTVEEFNDGNTEGTSIYSDYSRVKNQEKNK